jgi:hypothetical protein
MARSYRMTTALLVGAGHARESISETPTIAEPYQSQTAFQNR